MAPGAILVVRTAVGGRGPGGAPSLQWTGGTDALIPPTAHRTATTTRRDVSRDASRARQN